MGNHINLIIQEIRKVKSRLLPIMGDITDALIEVECNAVYTLLTKPCKSQSEQHQQQQIIECTPQSWADVVFQAVQLGVTLNTHLKHAAVVPYHNVATLTVMIAGLKHLLYVNEVAKMIDVQCVRQNDVFKLQKPISYETLNQNFSFQKALQNRGDVVGAYCLIYLTNGMIHAEYLALEEIMKRRATAKTKMIWDAWDGEMSEKTVLRYAIKDLPTFEKAALLTEIENQHIDLQLAQPTSTQQIQVGKAAQLPAAVEMTTHEQKQMSFVTAGDFEMEISDTWDIASMEQIALKIKTAKNDGSLLNDDRLKLLDVYKAKITEIQNHNKLKDS